jgi:hypothetical protein
VRILIVWDGHRMLARRLTTILQDMTLTEALDTTRIPLRSFGWPRRFSSASRPCPSLPV